MIYTKNGKEKKKTILQEKLNSLRQEEEKNRIIGGDEYEARKRLMSYIEEKLADLESIDIEYFEN